MQTRDKTRPPPYAGFSRFRFQGSILSLRVSQAPLANIGLVSVSHQIRITKRDTGQPRIIQLTRLTYVVMNQPTSSSAGGGTKLVLVAALMAIVSVVLTNLYIDRIRSNVESNTFTVYVLKVPAREGDRIRKQDVEAAKVPDTPVFRQAFESLGAITTDHLETRVQRREQFRRRANSGELLTYNLFNEDESNDIDRKITEGMRLIEIPVNSRNVPGALRVGAYVDIEAAFQTDRGIEVLPVMEYVKVIALGTRTAYQSPDERDAKPLRSFRSMTIEVTPEQATMMSMLERMAIGEFDLHLRNPGDISRVKIPDGGVNPLLQKMIREKLRNRLPLNPSSRQRN